MTILYIIAFLVVAGLAIWAFGIEPYRVHLHREDVPIPDLPETLGGLSIVHLSDLHVRRYDRRHRLAVRYIHSSEPDLIAITGDFGTENFSDLTELLYKLRYKAPVFGCIGNNDSDLEALRDAFRKTNARLLVDEAAVHQSPRGSLTVLGIQPTTPVERVRELVRDTPRPRLLLSHYPDIFDRIDDEVDLVLSGHTHGGQCRLPIAGPIQLGGTGRAYAAGLFRKERCSLFVTRGLGTYIINARFLCPPEVALLRLRR